MWAQQKKPSDHGRLREHQLTTLSLYSTTPTCTDYLRETGCYNPLQSLGLCTKDFSGRPPTLTSVVPCHICYPTTINPQGKNILFCSSTSATNITHPRNKGIVILLGAFAPLMSQCELWQCAASNPCTSQYSVPNTAKVRSSACRRIREYNSVGHNTHAMTHLPSHSSCLLIIGQAFLKHTYSITAVAFASARGQSESCKAALVCTLTLYFLFFRGLSTGALNILEGHEALLLSLNSVLTDIVRISLVF